MNDSKQYQEARDLLVKQIQKKGITNEQLLKAIQTVPRHLLIDSIFQDRAYDDRPLPIGNGQTISQPFTVAYQTQLLQVKPGDKVLEIGTGSGYQAAILCEMGAMVFSIERIENLHNLAKQTLSQLGYRPTLYFGDGHDGIPAQAPFDRILITAAISYIPDSLLQQMAIGGKLVAPIGSPYSQVMTRIIRVSKDTFQTEQFDNFVFVPMLKGTT